MIKSNVLKIILMVMIFLVIHADQTTADVTGGYDLNTEVNLTGIIRKEFDTSRGPGMFLFESNNRTYHLVTGPRWYLWQIGLSLRKGSPVEITGSKMFDEEGNVYLLVYDVKKLDTGELYQFRDQNTLPLWRGRGVDKRE